MNEDDAVELAMAKAEAGIADQIECARDNGAFVPNTTVLVARVEGTVFSVAMPDLDHDPEYNRANDPRTFMDKYIEPEWRAGRTDPDLPLYEALCDLLCFVTDRGHYKTDLTDLGDDTHAEVVSRVFSFLFWWVTKAAPKAIEPETTARLISVVSEPIRQTLRIEHAEVETT